MQEEIRHTWYFQQSPQEVWEYLTTPELLEQWLMKTDFQPIPGHKFRFTSPTGKIIHCEVLEINPYTNLSYSWQAHSATPNATFDTKVLWTVAPKGEGTELQLIHNGFTALEDYIAHNNGWTTLGNGFVELLGKIKVEP